ncbi:OmpL47-type beta-barrel domain-containing protein [Cohnella soli]|uniref:OmpL47-type beta-barrel domain-containing protein n=2 Tax=Cohnella soli TaxID=425005 RepID=A0ABW0HMZ1_9BACL
MSLVVVLSAISLSPAGKISAQGLGQWLWWSETGDVYHTFGANTNITINTGKMQIIPACSEGVSDGMTAWTDLYIVPSGSLTALSNGDELKDISGDGPNTVMSLSSGIFISETLGYTGPDGKIPPGKYAVVFDECQDGKYDYLVDGVIDPAFEVNYTTGVVPPLDLTQLKKDAEKKAKYWEKFHDYTKKLFDFSKAEDAHNPNEKFVDFLMRTGLPEPRAMALIQLANQAKHYAGIAADPPNPDYQHVTPLGDRPVIDFQSSDPLDLATQAVANEAAVEQAINQQMWTLLERYQGAQAAGDVNWALTNAKELSNNVNLLIAQLQRTNQSISRMNQALAADSRPLTDTAAQMEQLRSRVATSGFTNDEIAFFQDIGMSDAEIAQFKADFIAKDFLFTKADMLNWGAGLIDDNNVFGANLVTFGNQMVDLINQLLQDPAVRNDDPTAKAGGPYSGNEGSAIAFDGSSSSSSAGITKYEWDFNNDGNFDDAQGAVVSHTFTQSYTGLVGLKVTDTAGKESVDYAKVTVADVNRPPVISSSSPLERKVALHIGETKTFEVVATDPDNDATAVTWYVDGVQSGTGTSFAFNDPSANAGIHQIAAIVADAGTLGGSARISWTLQLLKKPQPGNHTPKAFFYPVGAGKNVAALEEGAKIEAYSSQFAGNGYSPENMLQFDPQGRWATAKSTDQWVKISLADGKEQFIDRIQIRPYSYQRVKDFEVAVSTTTLDDSAFTTVLRATAADNANLQDFKLDQPVMAKYILYKPLSSRESSPYISTQQFKVKTSQIGGPVVSFKNTSTDEDNDIVSWNWDFGDHSAVSTEKEPTHTFPSVGTYNVTLTVTDSQGHSNSVSLDQTVEPVDFEYLPKNPKEGGLVTFVNTTAGADEGALTSSKWLFHDNNTATGLTASRKYDDNKTYKVTLNVVTKDGQSYQVTKDVTVFNAPPTVQVGRDVTVRAGQKFESVTQISDPGGKDQFTCLWDFGDGTTSIACNFSHAYPAMEKDAPDKTYTANLTVTDNDGGEAQASKKITTRAERTPKLIAFYTFDDTFKDFSGNGNDAKPVMRTPTFVPGVKGKAAQFDPTSGLQVMDNDSLDLSTSFTFSMWLYKEDGGFGGYAPCAPVFAKGDTAAYGPYALMHDATGKSPGVRLVGGDSPNYLSFGFTNTPADFKQWYLATATWDGNVIKFYINGELRATSPWNGVLPNTTDNLVIGFDPPGITEYYHGLMDDFRIYNYALTEQEVKDLYNLKDPTPEDKTPPVTTASLNPSAPNGNNSWYTTNVGLTLSAVGEGSGIAKTEYRHAGGSWIPYSGQITISDEGQHSIEYRSIDNAGNVEDTKSVQVKVDKVAPSTVTTLAPNLPNGNNGWYTNDVTVTLSSTDTGSGLSKIEYRVDGGAWTNYGNAILLASEGTHQVEYRGVDQAGNVEDTRSVQAKVDKAAPSTVAFVTSNENNGWYTDDVTVALSSTDTGSGLSKIEYRVNGGEWKIYKSALLFTNDGTHQVDYRGVDLAGNVEDVKTSTIIIDKTAPEVSFNLNLGVLWPPNHKMVTIKVKPVILNETSGVKSIVLTSITSNEPDNGLGDGDTANDIQNAEYGTADFEFDLRAERSGKGNGRIYTITYTITDVAGNVTKAILHVSVPHNL